MNKRNERNKLTHSLVSAPMAFALALALPLVSFVSCGGGGDSGGDVPGGQTGGPNVYVAGFVREGATQVHDRATLWRNGVAQKLSNMSSYGVSVFVSGDDVYVAGYVTDADTYVKHAALWKTGAQTTETTQTILNSGDTESIAYSVAVSGSKVYVAGYVCVGDWLDDDPRATLWTDGTARTLLDDYSEAYSVHVAGGSVYVAGQGYLDYYRALIWKDGDAQTLAAYGSTYDACAYSVCVSGTDVYAAGDEMTQGFDSPRAQIWTNGAVQRLSNDYSWANSVAVSGSDVYVAGDVGGGPDSIRATLWKNGAATRLSNDWSITNSVAISGGDVYAAGTVQAGNASTARATLWKNGAAQTLSGNYSGAGSVFVK